MRKSLRNSQFALHDTVNQTRSLMSLPYDILTSIFCFIAEDVVSAVNLTLTCKALLLLGQGITIPPNSCSPREDSVAAPNTLQSCDLCYRYWLKGGFHDDPDNWSSDFKIIRDHIAEGFTSYRCMICPGGGETLRKWEDHRPRDEIRNRLAEELSIFQQALQNTPAYDPVD